MLAHNPFAERNFTTSNVSSYSHDRRYFPLNQPNNINRPGFLIPPEESFPKVTSDMRSPYFKLNSKPQPRTRNKYVQNPFYKSHLLEDSDSMFSSNRLYLSNVPGYSSQYGGYLSQSAVKPVQTDIDYKPYPSSYGKYGEYAYDPKELSKKQSRDKYNENSLGKKNSQSLKNLGSLEKRGSGKTNAYDNYDNRPVISMTDSKNYQNKSSNPEMNDWNEQRQGLLKKQSSSQLKNQRMQSNQSAIRKFDNISQRPSYEQDDPRNYDYPSFNMKSIIKKQESAQSPTWPGSYTNLNEERGYEDSTYKKKNINQGIQAVNPKMPNAPNTITYNGRMFYFVNVDEL